MNLFSGLISKALVSVVVTATIVGGAATYASHKTEINAGIAKLTANVAALKIKLDNSNFETTKANDASYIQASRGTQVITNLNAEVVRLNAELNKANEQIIAANNELSTNITAQNAKIDAAKVELDKANVAIATANTDQTDITAEVNTAVAAANTIVTASTVTPYVNNSLVLYDFSVDKVEFTKVDGGRRINNMTNKDVILQSMGWIDYQYEYTNVLIKAGTSQLFKVSSPQELYQVKLKLADNVDYLWSYQRR